jgi:hypothetical protein
MATQILRPSAAGDLTQFSTVSSGTHWEAVDESSADTDTYITSALDEGTLAYYIVIKENSTTTNISKSATTSFANYSNEWTTKPSDSSAFTVSDIDGLQIGVRFTGDDEPRDETDLFNITNWPNSASDTINSITVYARWSKVTGPGGSAQMRVTQVYVSVDYTAPAAVTTGPFKIEAGARVKITSGKLTIK